MSMRRSPGLQRSGYVEVEFAGLHGVSARGMRAKLDREGLSATSSHVGIDLVRSRWSEALDVAQTLGQKLIVVPSLPSDERSAEGLARVADDFNHAGEAAAAVGIRFGYHNHAWEFEPLADGRLPMDLLLDHTEADLVDWQMDVFWAVQGGADPLGSNWQTCRASALNPRQGSLAQWRYGRRRGWSDRLPSDYSGGRTPRTRTRVRGA